MTVASPEVEPQIPVSVACVIAGGSTSVRGSGSWIVSDLSGNDAGALEVLPETGNYSGLPREPGISPEIGNTLFFSGRTVPSGRTSIMCCPNKRIRQRRRYLRMMRRDGSKPYHLRVH